MEDAVRLRREGDTSTNLPVKDARCESDWLTPFGYEPLAIKYKSERKK
jgi:hypothetical protein